MSKVTNRCCWTCSWSQGLVTKIGLSLAYLLLIGWDKGPCHWTLWWQLARSVFSSYYRSYYLQILSHRHFLNWSFTAIRGLKNTKNLFVSTFAIGAVSSTQKYTQKMCTSNKLQVQKLTIHDEPVLPRFKYLQTTICKRTIIKQTYED